MQAAFDRATQLRGDATFVGVAGHAPEMFDWYGEFYSRVFYGGRVSRRIKELVRLRLSTAHGCAFCNKGNRVDAAAAGLTESQIAAIERPDDPVWQADERAALRLASQMMLTNPRGSLTAELYREARPHFDDAETNSTVSVSASTPEAAYKSYYAARKNKDINALKTA